MASKLSQLRQGIPPHKLIDIAGIKVMVVLVPSDITRLCEENTELYANANGDRVSDRSKSQYFDTLLAYHCMRDPDDPTYATKMADSVEEVEQLLDTADISRIMETYSELLMNKTKLELMNEGDYEELKKFLEATPLSDLNTVSLVHLTNFRQTIVSGS